MNAYDWALFRRSLLAAGVLALLTAATIVATDEATSTLGTRMARLAALLPLVDAAALLGISAHARSRGELRALESLGTAPWRSLRGAERAGQLVAATSLVVLMAPRTDTTSLLPAVRPLVEWTFAPDGGAAFARGLVVHANGALDVKRAVAPELTLRHATWHAVACVGPIAVVVPSWATTPMASLLRVVSGVGAALFAVVALHLVAADRIPPLFAVLAAAPIAASLARSRR